MPGSEVEIHVPISPTPLFLQQVHYLAASLRRWGGALAESPIVVTVGDDCEPRDLRRELPWTRAYPIRFTWTPRDLFRKYGYFGTVIERYRQPFRARNVLMLDADLIVIRDFDDLLQRVSADPAIYAMVAHSSPWQNTGLLNIRGESDWWRLLFETAGVSDPSTPCRYTGHGVLFNHGLPRDCPPYFNQGVLLAPSGFMHSVGEIIESELNIVQSVAETPYRFQIALTLAMLRLNLPWRAIPLRYNFTPGFTAYLKARPEEWEQAQVLHYTCTGQFEKERLMSSYSEMAAWIRRPAAPRDSNDDSSGQVVVRLREAFGELQHAVAAEADGETGDGAGSFALLDREQFASVYSRIAPFAADRPTRVTYPGAIFNIELTNRCPLRCVMCPRTADMTRAQGDMDFELFRQIIDELAVSNPSWSESVPVRLHGFGESLVHPQFDRFIGYAESHGIRTCLSINPLVLTRNVRARLLETPPSLLYISLDGHDNETFEQIRGVANAYDRSEANLLAFLREKGESQARSRVVVSMINFDRNAASIQQREAYWSNL